MELGYDLIKLIDNPNYSERITILDVGRACADALLQIKNTYKNAEIHGIKSNLQVSEIDNTVRRVTVLNKEIDELDYKEHYFDYIVFGDTLDHLIDPWNTLKNMRKYLKPDGKVLASIPNINHFTIIKNLINGNWNYETGGIGDISHLRFFTLNNIVNMFNEAGYEIFLCLSVKYEQNKEDKEFVQALSKLSKPEFSKQYEISHYLVKASMKSNVMENIHYVPLGKQKTFVTLYPETENVHLTKDVGMIAYIMYKHFDYDSHIACYKNGEYPYLNTEVKGLKIDFIDHLTGDSEEDGKKYLMKNASNIDVLHLFHLCKRSLNWIYIYKKLNPKGKVYLKLDASAYMEKAVLNDLIFNLLKLCDLISVETKHLCDYFNEKWPVRVEYLPNGFYDHGERKKVTYEEKENIICTVGRIGSPDKSNEILMQAFKLASPSLPGWKLKLIGPIAAGFKSYIEDFLNKNSDLKDKIIFTGEISDKHLLDEAYKKAKIFCLTSRMESFGIVFVESAKNGCYILSTNFYSSQDVTNNQKYGELFNFGDIVRLSEILVRSCNNDEKLRNNCTSIQDFAYENFYWVDICKRINNIINRE